MVPSGTRCPPSQWPTHSTTSRSGLTGGGARVDTTCTGRGGASTPGSMQHRHGHGEACRRGAQGGGSHGTLRDVHVLPRYRLHKARDAQEQERHRTKVQVQQLRAQIHAQPGFCGKAPPSGGDHRRAAVVRCRTVHYQDHRLFGKEGNQRECHHRVAVGTRLRHALGKISKDVHGSRVHMACRRDPLQGAGTVQMDVWRDGCRDQAHNRARYLRRQDRVRRYRTVPGGGKDCRKASGRADN